jgi:predicted DNA-binding transcriptional regulator AlpA
MALNYPPPWQTKAVLAEHISVSERTIENWVQQGKLPPPRRIGGLLLWRWSEVEKFLDNGGANVPDGDATSTMQERIYASTREAINATRRK